LIFHDHEGFYIEKRSETFVIMGAPRRGRMRVIGGTTGEGSGELGTGFHDQEGSGTATHTGSFVIMGGCS
jgi:hypothetical protein